MDIKTKKDEEMEKLVTTLRKNKLASSDSEARRMAEEMLSTSKKVTEDFTEREKKIFGEEKKSSEIELAQKQVTEISSNIAKGKPDVRIDVEGVDVSKPLKDIVQDDEPVQQDDDEVAVEMTKEPEPIEARRSEASSATETESLLEPQEEAAEPAPIEKPEVSEEVVEEPEPAEEVAVSEEPKPEKEDVDELFEAEPKEEPKADEPERELIEDEPEAEPEPEEPEKELVEDEPEPAEARRSEASSATETESPQEPAEEPAEEEPDVSIKELDDKDKPDKSDKERKKEIEGMPESKVDLADVFNANK